MYSTFGWEKQSLYFYTLLFLPPLSEIVLGAYGPRHKKTGFVLYAIILSWICCLLFASAVYTQVQFRLDFIMGANTLNPDRSEGSLIWVYYCLQ